MPYTLQDATVELVSPQEVLTIRRMSPSVALKWLRGNRPDLPPTAIDDLMGMCESVFSEKVAEKDNASDWKSMRSQFITAAWIVGASWYQIGQLFNITRQTARDASLRKMTNADRSAMRMNNVVSWERLSAMRDSFIQMYEDDSAALRAMDVSTIAKQLWELSDRLGDESEHSAYDQLESQ